MYSKQAYVLLSRLFFYHKFTVEFGEIPLARSGDVAGEIPTSKWKYLKLLHFLKDIKARASTGNRSGG